jgi:hypothetical protein
VSDEQTHLRNSGTRSRYLPLMGVVCILLVALLTTIQVTHVHKVGVDTSACPLCVILHSAAPVTPAAAAVVLVSIGIPAPVFKTRAITRYWQPKFFTRPPPADC